MTWAQVRAQVRSQVRPMVGRRGGATSLRLITHGDSITSSLQPVADPTQNYSNVLLAAINSRQTVKRQLTRQGISGHSFNYAWPSSGNPLTLDQDATINIDPLAASTAILIVFAGSNGLVLGGHTPIQEAADADTYLGHRLSAGFTAANIYVLAMYPRETYANGLRHEYNQRLRVVCENRGCNFVDVSIIPEAYVKSATYFPDDIHPSVSLHALQAEFLYDAIYQPTWTPVTIAALRSIPVSMWYDSQDTATMFTDAGKTTPAGSSAAVYVWADKSGNARDMIQATSSARPTRTLLNGVPSLAFASASSQYMAATGLSGMPSGAFTYATFAEFPGGNDLIFDSSTNGTTSNGFALRSQGQGFQVIGPGDVTLLSSVLLPSPASLPFSFVVSTPGDALFNGAKPLNPASAPAAATISAVRVGRGFNNGFQQNGRISEEILFAGVLNGVELLRLDTYLRRQQGLTDVEPDLPVFTDSLSQPVSTLISSNTITIAGLNANAQVSATSYNDTGSVSMSKNGAAFQITPWAVANGDQLQLKITTPASTGQTVRNIVKIGNRWVVWKVTT